MLERTTILNRLHQCSLMLLAALIASSTSACFAQDEGYKSDKISPDYIAPEIPDEATRAEKSALRQQIRAVKDKRTSDRKSAMNSMEGSFSAASIKPYVEGVILPQMTFTNDATLSQLGSLRASFLNNYISDAPAGNRQQMVTQILIPFAQRVINENYHPAAKLNAVLLLGMINNVDPSRNTMPQPNAACVNFLVGLMNDQNSPENLKIGAMVGISRNTLFDSKQTSPRIDGGTRNEIGSIALAIAKQTFAGQDQWQPETSYWLRRRSVQILGHLKNTATANTVLEILGNEDEKMWLRYDAMLALKEMNLGAAAADQALEKVTTYVAGLLKSESSRLESEIVELVSVNLLYGSNDLLKTGTGKEENEREIGSSFGIGDDTSSGGDEDDLETLEPKIDLPIYRTNDSRRLVQGVTYQAKQVLASLNNKVSGQQETVRTEIMSELDDLLAGANVGLVDLAEEPKDVKDMSDEEKKERIKGIADRMSELYAKFAKKLNSQFKAEDAAEAGVGIPGN